MTNHEVTLILKEISMLLAMDDVPFKPRAYEEAAHTVNNLEAEVADLYKQGGREALDALPGIGESIAEKIETLLKTGRLPYYEKLKKKYPVEAIELSRIEGVGAKMIKKLYQTLKIKTVEDLERAIRTKKLEGIRGFGKKTEKNLLHHIQFMRQAGQRFLLGEALPAIEKMVTELGKLPGVKVIKIAGSIRRMKETIGDVDLVAVADKPQLLMNAFVKMPGVAEVVAHGETKSMIRLNSGLDMDLRVVPAESIGAALMYFTGSRDHHIELRRLAIKKGWTLNEYGLFTDHAKNEKQRKYIAGRTEEDIYKTLGLAYIPPEMREMTGELEAAEKGKIPDLVGYEDIRGDLQVQTNWTDGAASIEEMARAAYKMGLEYLAITDHTKTLTFANGSDEKQLNKQMKEIDKLNKKLAGKPYILKGAEVNILKNGSLDIMNETLAKLDVVGAAVHSHFHLSKTEMTERICRAMRNPHVDILFHPTGRLINRRPPYEVDLDKIIRVAKETGTVLEINAAPDRLDLKDVFIKKAIEAGVRLSVDSDAHDSNHFAFMRYGIGQARRGWAKKTDIINAWPVKKMLNFLKGKKG